MATRTSTTMSKAAVEKLAAAVEELRAQVAALSERIAVLEKPGAATPPPAPVGVTAAEPEPAAAAAPPPPEVEEGISPEILLAISAAVAAYLGERAHVRAIRLVSTTRWSQEGRVSIQASHRLQRV
jgi:methylmalonyl-CoA carboxyltransferase large subunit